MMIYTVTLNPSVDYYMDVPDFTEAETNRARETMFIPGGKGINVTKVLESLGSASLALGFNGGFTGQFIADTLSSENVRHDFVQVAGETRVNVKLKTDVETEINGTALAIAEEDMNKLIGKLNEMKKDDWLVLSGSVPESLPTTVYRTITETVAKKGIRVVLDTSGDPMKASLGPDVYLVKPNRRELEWLMDEEIRGREDAIRLGKNLQKQGPANVLISLGGDGAILVTAESVFTAEVPPGKLRQSVGAGDSMVAGFIHGSQESPDDPQTAFCYAVAAGSATAYADGLADSDRIHKIMSHVRIQEWKGDEMT
ncbi:1-phosphofructokinase [Salisediminibacterium beveridgei]|uniref:Tagatose-6-phosphate kinase n=1 Tax=Salisediminibacterium beveridgei TaxID=632773 RepID=A0A1D7QS11_9BACI|nr:1-phosphofructokinase [Salisediminibacterium beveridgei]AOM81804.1 1-phosphofructokinase [Salisediminibacterium beveridgei]